MLSRIVIGALAAAASAGVVGTAAAEPPPTPPPPPPPNVNAFTPVRTSEYAVTQGSQYAFTTSDGLSCVLQRSGGYGCNGPLPGAPNGANLVSGSAGGVPGFSSVGGPVVPAAKALPAGSRVSFGTVSCGYDGTMTACVDGQNQSGFTISPTGTVILNPVNPLLDRPKGTNPYFN